MWCKNGNHRRFKFNQGLQMGKSKRTKEETIELFRRYQYEYEKEARRTKDKELTIALLAKATAYENAAFEIAHNME